MGLLFSVRRRVAQAQWKEHERGRHHDDLQQGLTTCAEPAECEVCVEISEEQRGLKEQHARVPDGGGSAETRQQHLGEHGLHEKEERGGEEGRGDEGPEHRRGAGPGRCSIHRTHWTQVLPHQIPHLHRRTRCWSRKMDAKPERRYPTTVSAVPHPPLQETSARPSVPGVFKQSDFVIAAVLVGVVIALAGFRTTGVAGTYHDDGIYIATAKSLAEGHG